MGNRVLGIWAYGLMGRNYWFLRVETLWGGAYLLRVEYAVVIVWGNSQFGLPVLV